MVNSYRDQQPSSGSAQTSQGTTWESALRDSLAGAQSRLSTESSGSVVMDAARAARAHLIVCQTAAVVIQPRPGKKSVRRRAVAFATFHSCSQTMRSRCFVDNRSAQPPTPEPCAEQLDVPYFRTCNIVSILAVKVPPSQHPATFTGPLSAWGPAARGTHQQDNVNCRWWLT